MEQVFFAFRWYLALQAFGLAALPLSLRLFRHLPGRGYAFARPLGLLVGGWAFWLLLTFGWLPNTAGAIVVVLALLATCGLVLSRRRPPASVEVEPPSLSWRHILAVELVLAVAFVAWCGVRAWMPRIETAGGEKWMEIAFLNAILRAPRFPPQDPWLSGFAISYYYFGYVIVGMLVRLVAVPATIGFNLGIATLFALTCTGSYGLVHALLSGKGQHWADWGGLLGPLMVVLTGNLEGLLEVFHARGLFPAAFWEWLDIRSINVAPPPLSEGSWTPSRYIWWWQASRVVHDTAPWHSAANPAHWEVIDEFPAFSFLLGDMHPHLLALPFVLLALALALALLFRRPGHHTRLSLQPPTSNLQLPTSNFHFLLPLPPWALLVYALCLGGLGFLNTWDFPIYLAVVVAAYGLGQWRVAADEGKAATSSLISVLFFAFLLAIGGFLFYLPFWLGFRSQAAGIVPNLFNGTRLPQFLVMFGPLLLPVVALVVAAAVRQRVRARDVALWSAAALLAVLVSLALVALLNPEARQYLSAWLSGGRILGLEQIPDASELIAARLASRLLAPWTPLALTLLLTATALTLLKPATLKPETLKPETSFALLLTLAAALLTLAVEFVYLRDHFGTRMNTVFKFYFQAWVMWGIAAAYGLAWLLEGNAVGAGLRARPSDGPVGAGLRARPSDDRGVLGDHGGSPLRRPCSDDPVGAGLRARPSGDHRGSPLRVAGAMVALLLIGGGLVYLLLAVPARARESGGPPTLDGAAYLRDYQAADFAAIDWLNRNVSGAEVILEAPGDQYRAYVYEGRVSAFTGLPTLLGWGGHQHQWRGNYDEPARREPDIATLYTTTDPQTTLTLLDRYGIRYVYVGPLERSRYPAAGLAKFDALLDVVYDADGVTIYRYTPP